MKTTNRNNNDLQNLILVGPLGGEFTLSNITLRAEALKPTVSVIQVIAFEWQRTEQNDADTKNMKRET